MFPFSTCPTWSLPILLLPLFLSSLLLASPALSCPVLSFLPPSYPFPRIQWRTSSSPLCWSISGHRYQKWVCGHYNREVHWWVQRTERTTRIGPHGTYIIRHIFMICILCSSWVPLRLLWDMNVAIIFFISASYCFYFRLPLASILV